MTTLYINSSAGKSDLSAANGPASVRLPPIDAIPPRSVMVLGAMTIGTSGIVMFDPAPCDLLFGVLFLICAWFGYLRVPVRVGLTCALGIALFMLGTACSLPFSYDDTHALIYVTITTYLFLSWYVFVALIGIYGPSMLEQIVRWLLFAALMTSVIGVLARFALIPHSDLFWRDRTGLRIKSTFKDPNVLGPFLVSVYVLYLGQFLQQPLWTSKRFIGFISVSVILLAALLFAFSRGAFIHLGVSIVVFVAAHLLIVREPQTRRRLIVSLAAVVGMAAVCLPPMLVFLDLNKIFVHRLQYQSYDNDRFASQKYAFETFQIQPMGIGPGQWTNETYVLDTHSLYLRILVENGFLALTGFLVFMGYCVATGVRGVMKRGPNAGIYVSALAVIMGELVNSIVIDTLHWRHLFIVLAICPGMRLWEMRRFSRGSFIPDLPRRARLRPLMLSVGQKHIQGEQNA